MEAHDEKHVLTFVKTWPKRSYLGDKEIPEESLFTLRDPFHALAPFDARTERVLAAEYTQLIVQPLHLRILSQPDT